MVLFTNTASYGHIIYINECRYCRDLSYAK